MKIIKLEKVDSTHTYIKEYIKNSAYTAPLAVVTREQNAGIGSRGNSWIGERGNLFFSFVISKDELPDDLPIQSSSIYFSYILKEILESYGSKVWLKWPNDFYIEDKKMGGTITTLSSKLLYCGIGLNLVSINELYGKLDIEIDVDELLDKYFETLLNRPLWKHIFSQFKVEFALSKKFSATIENNKESLSGASLNEDGSISINNKKVFSLR